VTTAQQLRLLHRSRNAAQTLVRTVQTMRQHTGLARLLRATLDRCVDELHALTRDTELVVELGEGELRCGGQPALTYGPTDVPFGLLAEQGIGELRLARDLPAGSIEQLIGLLSAADTDAEHDLASRLHRAHLPGVHLQAPDEETRTSGRAPRHTDWSLLPEPEVTQDSRRALERESRVSLAALAARLLLADLQAGAAHPGPHCGALLEGLLREMLAEGDAANAAWLLEQAHHQGEVTAEQALRLRSLALQSFASDWLALQIESQGAIEGLLSLAMQLGEDSVQRLAATATRHGVPLPDRVTSMLPADD